MQDRVGLDLGIRLRANARWDPVALAFQVPKIMVHKNALKISDSMSASCLHSALTVLSIYRCIFIWLSVSKPQSLPEKRKKTENCWQRFRYICLSVASRRLMICSFDNFRQTIFVLNYSCKSDTKADRILCGSLNSNKTIHLYCNWSSTEGVDDSKSGVISKKSFIIVIISGGEPISNLNWTNI